MKTKLRLWAEGVLNNPLYAALVGGLLMFVPFVEWLGWGWLALVTLRYGVPYSIWVLIASAIGLFLMVGSLGGLWVVAAVHVFLIAVPIWLLSLLLRSTISLTFTLQCAAVCLFVVMVIVDFFQLLTVQHIAEFLTSRYGQMMTIDAEMQKNIDLFAEQFASSWPSAFFWVYVLGLFLGRWWQAALDNPGGFQREFYALRLNYWVSTIGFIYLIMSFWLPINAVVLAASGLVVSLFIVAGLGFVHCWMSAKKWSGWALVAVYAGLLVLTLIFLPLLVVLALLDSVTDLRKKWIVNE